MKTLTSLLLIVALSGGLRADVIIVDAAFGYNEVADAVAAAADGDTLLITPSAYGGAVIDGKSLTLVARFDANTHLDSLVIRNLGADQTVVLRGISATRPTYYPLLTFITDFQGPGLLLQDNLGQVRIEGGTFSGGEGLNAFIPEYDWHPEGWPGIVIENCASVVVSRSAVRGGVGDDTEDGHLKSGPGAGGAGIHTEDSFVVVADCELTGGNGGSGLDDTLNQGGAGGHACAARSGSAYIVGSMLTGGDGGNGTCDAFLGGCAPGGRGGYGLMLGVVVGDDAHGIIQDNTYVPGAGGLGGAGDPAPDGRPVFVAPTSSISSFPQPARHMQADAPLREGQFMTLEYQGLPGDTLLVLASPAIQSVLLPAFSGALLVDRSAAGGFVLDPGRLGPDGDLERTFLVPELGPGVEAVTIHLQAVVDDGEAVWLGPTTAVVLLDGYF